MLFNCPPFYTWSPTKVCKISHKHLCRLCFTSTTLPTDQNWIALSLVDHCSVTHSTEVVRRWRQGGSGVGSVNRENIQKIWQEIFKYLYATSAIAKTWGLNSPNAAPLYCSIICVSYICGNLWNGFTTNNKLPVYVWKDIQRISI